MVFVYIYGGIAALLCIWLVAVCCCNAKTRYYKHGNHAIKVYAGWVDHYIEIDGQIVDRLKSMFFFNAEMKGEVDGKIIRVKLGQGLMGNTIVTFIDGKEAQAV
jgi:hypothetical protein